MSREHAFNDMRKTISFMRHLANYIYLGLFSPQDQFSMTGASHLEAS